MTYRTCRNGHLMDPANTVKNRHGYPVCRLCKGDRQSEYRERQRAAPYFASREDNPERLAARNRAFVNALRSYAIRHDDGSARVIRASAKHVDKPEASVVAPIGGRA